MNNYLPLLQTTSLFAGLEAETLRVLLAELGGVVRSYDRGETLIAAGRQNRQAGVLLAGELQLFRPARNGARVLAARIGPGGVFGVLSGASGQASPVAVEAAAPCEALLLSYERLLLPNDSPARQKVAKNLARMVSGEYFQLARRMELMTVKPLRAKVCDYLLGEAERNGSQTFTIPFSRVQLAEYLNCDRSALSRELSLMQQAGLLETYKSSFKLLDAEGLRGELR